MLSMVGTLAISADAPPPKIRIINYTKETVDDREITELSDLAVAHEPESVN